MLSSFRFSPIVLALCVAAVIIGCKPARSLPTVEAEIVSADNRSLGVFTVEVAATEEERAKGLMFRRELGAKEGMLFLFPHERLLSFWMKNTLIPLDMVFISHDWRVVGIIEKATPLSEESRGVDRPSKYVLEFDGGTAARLGIGQGATVKVQGELPQAR